MWTVTNSAWGVGHDPDVGCRALRVDLKHPVQLGDRSTSKQRYENFLVSIFVIIE